MVYASVATQRTKRWGSIPRIHALEKESPWLSLECTSLGVAQTGHGVRTTIRAVRLMIDVKRDKNAARADVSNEAGPACADSCEDGQLASCLQMQ